MSTDCDSELIADICTELTGLPVPLFVRQLRDSGLSDRNILIVMQAINGICTECWNAPAGCCCYKDDRD